MRNKPDIKEEQHDVNNTSMFDKLSKDEILNYLAIHETMEYYANDKPADFDRLKSRIKDISYFLKNGKFRNN